MRHASMPCWLLRGRLPLRTVIFDVLCVYHMLDEEHRSSTTYRRAARVQEPGNYATGRTAVYGRRDQSPRHLLPGSGSTSREDRIRSLCSYTLTCIRVMLRCAVILLRRLPAGTRRETAERPPRARPPRASFRAEPYCNAYVLCVCPITSAGYTRKGAG